MRLLREIGSDHRFRIIETCGYNDQPLAEDPKVVDFSIRTATLIPIYADPVGKKDTPPPPEMVLEENYMSYRYVFVDIQSLLLFQQAVTGFKVEYME